METTGETKRKYEIGGAQSIFLLTVMTLLYLMNYADRSILSVALQSIKIDLALSDSEIGIIQSAFSIGVGLLAIPASFLVDRWSRKKSLGLMALLWSGATCVTGLCVNLWQMIVTRFFVGVGEGAYFPGSTGWLSLVFPKERRARIMTIYSLGAPLGTIVGLILGGIIIAKTGDWRMAFFIFAIPGIILGIMTFFFKDYITVKDKGEKSVNKQYLSEWIGLFRSRFYTLITLGQCFWGLFSIAVLGWLPAMFMRGYNMNTAQVGTTMGLMVIAAAVCMPLIGWLADVWQKRNKSGRAYMMSLIQLLNFVLLGAAMLAYGAPLPIFMAILTPAIVVMTPPGALTATMLTDIIPVKYRVTGHALQFMILYFVGASLGPWLVGLVSDAFGGGSEGLKYGFLCILPALLLGTIFHFINARKYYAGDSAKCHDNVFSE
jgi:MFS family permease